MGAEGGGAAVSIFPFSFPFLFCAFDGLRSCLFSSHTYTKDTSLQLLPTVSYLVSSLSFPPHPLPLFFPPLSQYDLTIQLPAPYADRPPPPAPAPHPTLKVAIRYMRPHAEGPVRMRGGFCFTASAGLRARGWVPCVDALEKSLATYRIYVTVSTWEGGVGGFLDALRCAVTLSLSLPRVFLCSLSLIYVSKAFLRCPLHCVLHCPQTI